ncbi:AAA family ATPase [Bacillus rubiinfantis]|uniref:AAA family ATPase n=1 Tax=Bacillus rubiinfantis TaxID=1499680 RepID=UPI0005A8EC0F|nr:AAA family ATPase [Bacillus rubiinfantis]
MATIKVNLFGNYLTTVDNRRITFPYGKAEALFYYLIVNKIASRDQLATLLWSDMDDKNAKKNLRNALYTLKKLFANIELFTFYGLTSVSINKEVGIQSDYDDFFQSEDYLEQYQGEFLKGYSLKDADEFERWMYKVRDDCNFIHSQRLQTKMLEYKESKNYLQLENICRKIIDLDVYDETGYIELMNAFKEQQKYSNAIVIYNELSDLLLKDLEVAPNEEARKVYHEVLDLLNDREKVKQSKKFFIGRDKEIHFLKTNYQAFKEQQQYHSILISGDMGVGKTRLKEYFLHDLTDNAGNTIEANCYQFEENYVLRPWKTILVNLLKLIKAKSIAIPSFLLDVLGNVAPEFGNYKKEIINVPRSTNDSLNLFKIEDVILEVLKLVSYQKKLIIVFEDIHWMDALSLRLLDSLMVNDELSNCLFLLTMRKEMNPELEKFLVYINNYAKVQTIELMAFNECEVKRYIERALPQEKNTTNMFHEIYQETEGNAFFLTEYIQAMINTPTNTKMSTRMMDVLKSRFIDLNKFEKRIVEIASLFYDVAPLSILKNFIDLDELDIIEAAESLVEKGLLKEITNRKDICYAFVHQKLREFEYMQIPEGKKRILHNRIADILQLNLHSHPSDVDTYYKLIYHYEKACNDIEALRYQIKNLSMFLNFIHERFPTINFDHESFNKLYIGESHIEENLENLVSQLQRVKHDYPVNKDIIMFEMNVLYLIGRFNIRKGYYGSGLEDIENLIRLAEQVNSKDFLLKGLEQKSCYAIQTRNTKVLKDVLMKALPLVNLDTAEGGLWIRYQGMYEYLKGNAEKAEEYFREGIRIHSQNVVSFEKYRLNIAACYNNIGILRKDQGNFDEALQYYQKAISICNEVNYWICLSLFKTNAGVACYHAGNYTESKRYLESALVIYNKLAYNLSQPLAEIYMCLLLLREKDYHGALNFLQDADEHAQILKNPQELLSVVELKKAIAMEMETNQPLYDVFHKYVTDEYAELDINEKEYK